MLVFFLGFNSVALDPSSLFLGLLKINGKKFFVSFLVCAFDWLKFDFMSRLMGKVASDKCHKWVFKEPTECEPNISNYWQSSFDAVCYIPTFIFPFLFFFLNFGANFLFNFNCLPYFEAWVQ